MAYVDGDVDLSSPLATQQDQLILGWLLTALSPTILPQVAALRTSAEVWKYLNDRYALASQTRSLHLRFKLQSLRKGTLSMDEYLSQISTLKDALAIAGEDLQESELILITLGGLGGEYESFVTTVTTRLDASMTFSSLQSMLMDQKIRFQAANTSAPITPMANVVTKVDARNMAKTTLCQICLRKGHGAINCFDRINLSKFPPTHGRELSPLGLSGMSDVPGLVSNLKSVNMTTRSSRSMDMWYPNSGTTSHITSSLQNIQMPRAYNESLGPRSGN